MPWIIYVLSYVLLKIEVISQIIAGSNPAIPTIVGSRRKSAPPFFLPASWKTDHDRASAQGSSAGSIGRNLICKPLRKFRSIWSWHLR